MTCFVHCSVCSSVINGVWVWFGVTLISFVLFRYTVVVQGTISVGKRKKIEKII